MTFLIEASGVCEPQPIAETIHLLSGVQEEYLEDDEEDDDDDNWDDDDDDDYETPNCPKCESEDVEDDGTGYLQYLCNDCGNRWGDDTEECPYCGAKDCVDDGTGYIQYTCNECGEVWGDDDD